MNESITLHSQKNGADKAYKIQLSEVEGGFTVTGYNGRRGGALKAQPKTPTPVPYVVAKKIYDDLIKDKMKGGGYTPADGGSDYQAAVSVGIPTGIELHLLTQAHERDVHRFINDDSLIAQEKRDGERRPVSRKQIVIGGNKNGFQVPLTVELAAVLSRLPEGTTLDTEQIGGTLYVFDIMDFEGRSLRSLPYTSRQKILESCVAQLGEQSCVVAVETAVGTAAKQAMYERLRATRKEGIVFKRGCYCAGKNLDQIKVKFTESATLSVSAHHPTKRSVAVQAFAPTGEAVALGWCLVPVNYPMPAIAELVEIEYLYVVNSLVQPVYRGVRTDQTLAACSTTQLKYKDGIGDDDIEIEDKLLAA